MPGRLFCTFVLVFIVSSFAKSQHVGLGTNTPDASAVFEIKSTSGGFLPPRMNFTQRNTISNPATGLMIFCTDCDSSGQPQYYNGHRWCNMMGGVAANPIFVDTMTVLIGSQVWSAQNLSVSSYRNGDIIPQITNTAQWANATTGAWCWYNNDSVTYAAKYGKLYNWYAVNDSRGLAPVGWHVPSESDWNKLVKYLDPTADTTCQNCTQSTIAGGFMKESSVINWLSPNVGANNNSHLACLPGGYRYSDGLFYNIRYYGYFWSSADFSATQAGLRYLFYNDANINRYNFVKSNGFSVRLIRD